MTIDTRALLEAAGRRRDRWRPEPSLVVALILAACAVAAPLVGEHRVAVSLWLAYGLAVVWLVARVVARVESLERRQAAHAAWHVSQMSEDEHRRIAR